MSLDFSFDMRSFLERTCRSCSRYYQDDGTNGRFYALYTAATSMEENAAEPEPGGLVPNPELRDIYDEMRIWKLNIKPQDGLPQQICHVCLERFRGVHQFREECIDSQRVLESYFKDFDAILERANSIRGSPRSDTGPNMSPSLDDLLFGRGMGSPSGMQQQQQGISYSMGSPGSLRLSPLGTPPPLFEEISNTMAADVRTAEDPKVDDEQMKQVPVKQEIKDEEDEETKTEVRDSDNDERDNDGGEMFSDADSSEEEEEEEDDDAEDLEGEEDCGHDSDSSTDQQTAKRVQNAPLRHAMAKDIKLPYACEICNSAFKKRKLLLQHKQIHKNPKSYQCELCSKWFRSQLHLQRHAKNYHLTSTYTCHICHQKFENYTQFRFQYHVRQHGEKRFNCSYCEKSFHQKIHLTNHEKTHTKEQPYSCQLCGNAYRTQNSLRDHLLKHKTPFPFKCNICNKGYTQRCSLRLHYRSKHPDDKAYDEDMDLCSEKSYTGTANLSKKMKQGSSFGCGLCGKAFAQADSLKAHMKTHNSQQQIALKQFKCQQLHGGSSGGKGVLKCYYCSRKFETKSSLEDHLLTHMEFASYNTV